MRYLRGIIYQADCAGLSKLRRHRDYLACIHFHGLLYALYFSQKRTPSFTLFRSLFEINASSYAQFKHREAMVDCVCFSKAEECMGPSTCSTIRRFTTSFVCRNNACSSECLRAIACVIKHQPASVLGNVDDDKQILQQVCSPRALRSNRSADDTLKRLHSRTPGPLPLLPSLGDLTFRRAIYHVDGWVKNLVPLAPNACPSCLLVLPSPRSMDVVSCSGNSSDLSSDALCWLKQSVSTSDRPTWVIHNHGAFEAYHCFAFSALTKIVVL